MNSLQYRLCSIPDCYYVAARMRPADIDEVSSRGSDPLNALLKGYVYGDRCTTVLKDDEPIAIYGCAVTSKDPRTASVWMLGTDKMYTHRYAVLRDSRDRLDLLGLGYQVLWNYVDSRNHLHIRWLQWLGFSFIRSTTEVSVDGTPFYEFAKLNHVRSNHNRCQ